ncbi:hypothetical protein JRQ81_004463 [Phrynocephalus forsythii]|uniref:Uncharacterized protein n=1 Tax=Phrynocephalus forsythii TaxID=171643 RepID=A0A9Q0XG74_9SAUR|nr:hypothetical protein JRQ81_004463 [Phrynocephalus forsythii]
MGGKLKITPVGKKGFELLLFKDNQKRLTAVGVVEGGDVPSLACQPLSFPRLIHDALCLALYRLPNVSRSRYYAQFPSRVELVQTFLPGPI